LNSVEAIAEHSPQSTAEDSSFDLEQVKLVLETALLTTQEPMSLGELRKLFDQELGPETLRRLLEEIRAAWSGRGVELTNVASGWRFCTKAEMQVFLDRLNPQRPPKYSRAVLETLAIIVYRQPVTRGDIEEVRGVTVSTNIVKALEVRGWIEVIGHREVPGRPALYATTRQFLDDLGLRSLEELPPLEDLGSLVEAGAAGAPQEASDRASESPLLPAAADAGTVGLEDEGGGAVAATGSGAAPESDSERAENSQQQEAAHEPAGSADSD